MRKINALGERVEKGIRYNKENDTYYVHFSFRDIAHLKGFPTLQDAIAYRDAVNAEKLRIKTQEVIEEIRKYDKEEILRSNDVYPYNAFESMGLNDFEVPLDIVNNFDNILKDRCSEREELAIQLFYRERKTLKQIGDSYGLTRERIRQIIVKGLKKAKFVIYKYDTLKKEEEKRLQELEREKALENQRQELICEFREKGVITEGITVYFGKPTFSIDPVSEEEKYIKSLTIADLDLSVRSYNCLKRAGIDKVTDLISKTSDQLLRVRNMGRKSVKEIKERLAYNGLCLAD